MEMGRGFRRSQKTSAIENHCRIRHCDDISGVGENWGKQNALGSGSWKREDLGKSFVSFLKTESGVKKRVKPKKEKGRKKQKRCVLLD